MTDEIRTRLTELRLERERLKVRSESGKIMANGVFGKLGSTYSYLFSPRMLLATTLTGQLSILMFIERVEDAGMKVVSANTDGIALLCPKERALDLDEIVHFWEKATSFSAERTQYRALFNSSVNSYIAVKLNNRIKLRGPLADPWSDGDLRGMMSKNPQMTVLTDAVVGYLRDGRAPEETVTACADPRKFVAVIRVNGGAVWRGLRLGRVARFYWSVDGEPIRYADGSRKVAKTDGAAPLVELTERLPPDIDRPRYVAEAKRLVGEYGCPDFQEKGLLG